MFHEKIKHIDIRFNFILDITTLSDIVVKKIDTEDNLTNMLTKSFPLFKLKHHDFTSKGSMIKVKSFGY